MQRKFCNKSVIDTFWFYWGLLPSLFRPNNSSSLLERGQHGAVRPLITTITSIQWTYPHNGQHNTDSITRTVQVDNSWTKLTYKQQSFLYNAQQSLAHIIPIKWRFYFSLQINDIPWEPVWTLRVSCSMPLCCYMVLHHQDFVLVIQCSAVLPVGSHLDNNVSTIKHI